MKNKFNSAVKISGGLLAGMLAPGLVHACACGCGVFDVATSSMFPNGQGGMAYLQYDYQDQNRNWSGTSRAPAANNGDKEIETDFLTVGLQYMFNSSWGVQFELPYDYRKFTTVSANQTSNGIVWAVANTDPAILYAYDATNLANQLYNSNQAGTRDQFGPGNKFITPMIANGKVFVGTQTGVAVFGLLQ